LLLFLHQFDLLHADDRESDYYNLAVEIKDAHENMEKIYTDISLKMKDINTQSQNWVKDFEMLKNIHKNREEKRMDYDHYDAKLEELYKEKDERTRNNKTESSKDFEKLNRVIILYLK
jgi:hypothetical protein